MKSPVNQHFFLQHCIGIDRALISPHQWLLYQQEQTTSSAMGGEKGRKACIAFNNYIRQKVGLQISTSPNRVAYSDPKQIIKLILDVIKSRHTADIDLNKHKLIIRVSFDGRNIKPFNVVLSWTLLGFSTLNWEPGQPRIVINTRDIFPTQHWTSCIAMVLYEGKETYQDVVKYCPEVQSTLMYLTSR